MVNSLDQFSQSSLKMRLILPCFILAVVILNSIYAHRVGQNSIGASRYRKAWNLIDLFQRQERSIEENFSQKSLKEKLARMVGLSIF